MPGVIRSGCVALFLILTSVSAVQKLRTINDLKKVNFGPTVPSHTLLLLHWFASTVDIDNNNVVRLTFDPNRGDYGSHHYGNYERLLELLPRGNTRYFTVGNLYHEMSSQLPSYVVHPRQGYEGRNRDRIIFRVREQNLEWQSGLIDRVYITQHYQTSDNLGTAYDPAHTYEVTINLLSQIRQFSTADGDRYSLQNLRDRFGSRADDSQMRYLRNTWGDLACLGLLLFIVIQEKNISDKPNNRRQPQVKRNTQPDFVVHIPERRPIVASQYYLGFTQPEMQLRVTTSTKGKAKIIWHNVPVNCLNEGAMVVLYRNDEAQTHLTYKSIGNAKSGIYNTSVPLNEGLQVRLHKIKKLCCFWTSIGEEIHRGGEFETPSDVSIKGYSAKLQLFAKDGKAGARLYVRKTFNDWKSEFKRSWVGFYSSGQQDTGDYEWWQWQWATKFNLSTDCPDTSYDVYEYCSGMAIAPGVQARFILHGHAEKARTPGWTG
ncbi:unnamed protein product [Menidia menidia]|uniref:(Atlantic silverside) hypothetical protein n=1 Tax=Menidia menidia TaxID=238744 RepID=A0A8S4B0H2_9TELE|nr:unnamed protein product [Menidia menidia]